MTVSAASRGGARSSAEMMSNVIVAPVRMGGLFRDGAASSYGHSRRAGLDERQQRARARDVDLRLLDRTAVRHRLPDQLKRRTRSKHVSGHPLSLEVVDAERETSDESNCPRSEGWNCR